MFYVDCNASALFSASNFLRYLYYVEEHNEKLSTENSNTKMAKSFL